MKILISTQECDAGNPFVYSLYTAFKKMGHQVSFGHDNLMCGPIDSDFLLLQWPEEIFGWKTVTLENLSALDARLKAFKDAGCVIGYTRHNLLPHYNKDPNEVALYRLVESQIDIAINMGKFSQRQFAESGINGAADNIVVPHHLTCEGGLSLSVQDARSRLGIAVDEKVVLAFGRFRANEERDMVINAFNPLCNHNKRLLMPSLFMGKIITRYPIASIKRIFERFPYRKYGSYHANKVPAELMPYYFRAADVVLIPRKKILNSGNLPMAFNYGKVVVGPDRGNVGEILRETGNPVFNPDDLASVSQALERGLELSAQGLGERNYQYAMTNWDVDCCARKIIAAVESRKRRNVRT